MTSSRIIYSFLILGTGILCEGKLERRQAALNNDDNFVCTNGLYSIEWSLVCDGHKDCLDGSDETKELCARYEYRQNINMDCGMEVEDAKISQTPWLVYIHRYDKIKSKKNLRAMGFIIAPNVFVAMLETSWRLDLKYKQNSMNVRDKFEYKVHIQGKQKGEKEYYINVTMIYFVKDYNIKIASAANNFAVIVLADKISSIRGVLPICIDWYNEHRGHRDSEQSQLFKTPRQNEKPVYVSRSNLRKINLEIDHSSCLHLYDTYNFTNSVTYDKSCIRIINYQGSSDRVVYNFHFLNILHSNQYYLTGLNGYWSNMNKKKVVGFIDISYYVPWIRGILNKHGTVKSRVKPTINCGKSYIKTQLLIANGEIANVGSAPWNVGIYKIKNHYSNYDLKCGGSIITPNFVVSAAHCFWDKTLTSNTISVKDGKYKIAVGKYTRDFKNIDNQFTKIMDVKIVYLEESFNGLNGHYAGDIAIIVLKNRISFNDGVAPACIDWNGQYNVVDGDEGKIVGWGKTEKGIYTPMLLEASLPYFCNRLCRKMFKNGFDRYVTPDKFCAGCVTGQGMASGDSGAGLCFLHSDSYYLTGVASCKDPETNNSMTVFTDIKNHIKWIRGLFTKHN